MEFPLASFTAKQRLSNARSIARGKSICRGAVVSVCGGLIFQSSTRAGVRRSISSMRATLNALFSRRSRAASAGKRLRDDFGKRRERARGQAKHVPVGGLEAASGTRGDREGRRAELDAAGGGGLAGARAPFAREDDRRRLHRSMVAGRGGSERQPAASPAVPVPTRTRRRRTRRSAVIVRKTSCSTRPIPFAGASGPERNAVSQRGVPAHPSPEMKSSRVPARILCRRPGSSASTSGHA